MFLTAPGQFILTSDKYVSDAGIKIGMTKDEFFKTLRSKYVKKSQFIKEDHLKISNNENNDDNVVLSFAMQETLPYNLFMTFKEGKLVNYTVAPY